jgi:Phage integrase family
MVVERHALLNPASGQRLGTNKRVGWHTFRRTYTTLLHANGKDMKVVQELLRHSSSRIRMDAYAQAQTPAKRAAERKGGGDGAGNKNCKWRPKYGLPAPQNAPPRKHGKSFKCLKELGSPTRFEPVLPP